MRRLLVLLLLLAVAPPAHAQEYSSTVSPETVHFGSDSDVTWRITIKTGDEAVKGDLVLEADAVSPAQHGADGFNAAGIDASDVRLEGPGEVRAHPVGVGQPHCPFGPLLPAYGQRLQHGYPRSFAGGSRFSIDLPANSESVLVVPTALSRDAPWPGTAFGLIAKLAGKALELPRARLGDRSLLGVPLSFTTDPPATQSDCSERPRFPYGTVKVMGRTDPALSGHRVTVIEAQPDMSRSVGEATVQADGTFVLDGWRPAPGDHTIALRYMSQRPDRTDDFAHPQWFSMDEPPPPETVRPVPLVPVAALSVRVPRLSGRHVVVTVRCPATLGTCRGVGRLFRGRSRLVARRYAVGAERAGKVRLPLAVRERRLLRRRGRLAVRVVVTPAGGDPVTRRVTLRRR